MQKNETVTDVINRKLPKKTTLIDVAAAYELGVNKDIDPFMTLSFMSLPVIPKIKITTQGVFDVERWEYI